MDKKCFIICPIGEEDSETRKRSNKVYNHLIKPVCESLGYDLIRSDKIASAGKIDIEIINYLDSAELAIADLTGLNPNVFYELGYREAKGLPCVQIALEGTELPFDRSTFRTQFYSISDLDKVEEIKTILKEVIQNVERKNNGYIAMDNTLKNIGLTPSDIASYEENIKLKDFSKQKITYHIHSNDKTTPTCSTEIMTFESFFYKIGLMLIEEKTQHEIEQELCKDIMFQNNMHKDNCTISLSRQSLSEFLLRLLALKYIKIDSTYAVKRYVLTDLGKSVLIQLSKDDNG